MSILTGDELIRFLSGAIHNRIINRIGFPLFMASCEASCVVDGGTDALTDDQIKLIEKTVNEMHPKYMWVPEVIEHGLYIHVQRSETTHGITGLEIMYSPSAEPIPPHYYSR